MKIDSEIRFDAGVACRRSSRLPLRSKNFILHDGPYRSLLEGFNANKRPRFHSHTAHRTFVAIIIDVINFQFIYLSSLSVKLKNDERIHRNQLRMTQHQIAKVCME